jgi:hypothetical protein
MQQMTRKPGYTTRQAAYDLRKLRGKTSSSSRAASAATKSRPMPPAPSPPCWHCATTSSPRSLRPHLRRGRMPACWTQIDRDYENLRTGMQTLFHDLGITVTVGPPHRHRQPFVDQRMASC